MMPLSFSSQNQVIASTAQLKPLASKDIPVASGAPDTQKPQSGQAAKAVMFEHATTNRRVGIFEKRSSLLNPMDLLMIPGMAGGNQHVLRKSRNKGGGDERSEQIATSRTIAGNFKHSMVQVCEEIRP